MAREFSDPAESYKPDEAPETRYQKAKKVWDERIGSARAQAKNWRLLALGLLVSNALLIVGLIYQSTKSVVKPYVVEVTSEGVVKAVGPAEEKAFVPGRPVIEYFLAQFVSRVRSIPLDPVVARKNWLDAYAYLRQAAATKLNGIVQSEQPLNRVGLEVVSIQVRTIVPLSKDTYQVRWTETTYSKEGAVTGVKNMTGAFTIEFSEPKNEQLLRVNPLGLYIRDFSWASDIS